MNTHEEGLVDFSETSLISMAGGGFGVWLTYLALRQLEQWFGNEALPRQLSATELTRWQSIFAEAMTGCKHAIEAGQVVITNPEQCSLTPVINKLLVEAAQYEQLRNKIIFDFNDVLPAVSLGLLWLIDLLGNGVGSIGKSPEAKTFIRFLAILQAVGSYVAVGHLNNLLRLDAVARQEFDNPFLSVTVLLTALLSIYPTIKSLEMMNYWFRLDENIPKAAHGALDVVGDAMRGTVHLASNVRRRLHH
ncbi:MAG: hypothetical protein ACOZAN_00960 [Patescibacteria group bacterium]